MVKVENHKNEIEKLVERCLESAIDPRQVLSTALQEKGRIDGLIQEVLNEDKQFLPNTPA